MSGKMRLPHISPAFGKQLRRAMENADLPMQTMEVGISGEITTSQNYYPVGVAIGSGEITDFVVALAQQGRDDTNPLSLAVDLKVDGTSVISGEATLTAASGEASSSIVGSAPTINSAAVSRGKMISINYTITRTATPTTEMKNLFAAVKIKPV